jgi:hypothetical protein
VPLPRLIHPPYFSGEAASWYQRSITDPLSIDDGALLGAFRLSGHAA